MNKAKLLVPILLLGFLGIAGCVDDLTENPFSSITQENITYEKGDFAYAIGPVYSNLRGLMGFFNYFTQEITTDEMVQPANPSGWDDGGRFRRMHLHTWTALQDHVSSLWSTLYRGVIHANNIIAQLEDGTIQVPDDVTKEAAIAEVKTARAFYYWLILDNYGDAPLTTEPSGASQDLPGKTPRAEIYQFVVDELQAAIPHLSPETGTPMYARFNRWAAKTLLAAVYLNAEVYTGTPQWENVVREADDVIASGRYALEADYREPFRVYNEGSEENIFAIPYDEINAGGFNLAVISLHASMQAKYQMQAIPWGAGSAKAVPQFGALYDSTDKRKEYTWITGVQVAPSGDTLQGQYDDAGKPLVFSREMADGVYTSEDAGWRIGKFEIETGTRANQNNDFPFFRYARVLMMKAEALLRMGQAAQAAAIVSEVRARAFDDPADAVVTADDLLKDTDYEYGYWEDFKIVDPGDTSPVQYGGFLDELGREFAAEMYRRRDMIRFGVFTTKSWLSHRPNGDYRTVFPIPEGVVQSNVNLEQHPNY